jgi:hypothetical protein
MKIKFMFFLLTSIFIIKASNLTAQEQLEIPLIDFTQTDLSSDSVELRKIKISTSKLLQGLATALVCIAQVAGAKTKKEKQESACNVISSVFQIAADACEKHKKHTPSKQDQLAQVNLPEDEHTETQSQCLSESTEEVNATKNTETKSINYEYLQKVQDLNTDQEKVNLLDKILQNKQATESLLDEVNAVTKLLLIDALFE